MRKVIFLVLFLLWAMPSLAAKKVVKTSKKFIGEASWYGKQHQGKKMANGQRFDMYKFTAASLWLPFGTVIRVFNLQNGKSVDVVITDRGPHVKGRILDLSYAAAQKLGLKGVGPVFFTLPPEPETTSI